MKISAVFLSVALAAGVATMLHAQTNVMQGMPNMGGDGANQVDHAMSTQHMDMGPHMKMTAMRSVKPGDQERAQQIVEAARRVCEKYKDYKVALADGFHIFMPTVRQEMYHFNNFEYAHEAAEHFNPEHPTSLLYQKDGDGYMLIGVMYTAPKWTSQDELNERVPLSIAQWHAHVNLCLAPPNRNQAGSGPGGKFGINGSISTQGDCEAAGGRFVPQIFGWMVHVYPFEQKPEDIWSVERQMHGMN